MPTSNEIVTKILTDMRWGTSSVIICVFIPEKQRDGASVNDRAQWAQACVTLLSELYTGATGFPNLVGGWYDPEQKKVLVESPIMVQTLTTKDKVEDEGSLKKVVDFCKRMGKKTNQGAVGLVVNNVMYYIDDYGGV